MRAFALAPCKNGGDPQNRQWVFMSALLDEPRRIDEPSESPQFSEALTQVASSGQTLIVRRDGEDLAAVSRALKDAEGSVGGEVAATSTPMPSAHRPATTSMDKPARSRVAARITAQEYRPGSGEAPLVINERMAEIS